MLGTMPGSPAARPGRLMPGGAGAGGSGTPHLFLPSSLRIEGRTTELVLEKRVSTLTPEERATNLTIEDPKGDLTLNG